ncbi:MAG: TauD/TfdA family dioxygenase [Pseudomonadota bacterium]
MPCGLYPATQDYVLVTNQGVAFPQQFDGQSAEYLLWREHRLQQQNTAPALTMLSPRLDQAEDLPALQSLCRTVRNVGFAVYQWSQPSDDASRDVMLLHDALSLRSFDTGVVHDDDGLSLLTDLSGTSQGRFIPYTKRAMGWHTDGYYNTMEQSLHCFTIHCISPAHSGGALTLLDNQLMLIALFDTNPELVTLLSHPQAMMLPANRDELGHDRPARYSPVLFIRADGTPGAHFTTRTKNIEWRSSDTLDAALRMKKLIDQHPRWHHTVTLQCGQGVITRNVLHRREAYTDHPDAPRKMLRGRYLHSPVILRDGASSSINGTRS